MTTWLGQERRETTMSAKSFMVVPREHVLSLQGGKVLGEVGCVSIKIEGQLRREKLGEVFP